jgi:hypothetical protein
MLQFTYSLPVLVYNKMLFSSAGSSEDNRISFIPDTLCRRNIVWSDYRVH